MATFVAGSFGLKRSSAIASVFRIPCSGCATRPLAKRTASLRTSANQRGFASNSGKRPKFSHRLAEALKNSKIQWYQIPVGLGIGFLGLVQFYKVSARERRNIEDGEETTPKKRQRIRPDGPWYDQLFIRCNAR